MKVLLVGNYVPDGQTSMLAFRRVLERELPRLGCELRVVAPDRRVLHVASTRRLWKWLGYVDKFILFLPSLARHARWADVVHIADHSNGMYIPRVRGTPNVITCHDVIAVQAARGMVDGWKVGWTGRLFQRLIAKGLSQADLVACVSDLTRRDLLALGLAQEGRVTTVLNGLNDDFKPVAADVAQGLIAGYGLKPDDTYLIHVGWDLARKNRRAVLDTFIALQKNAAASGVAPLVRLLVFVGPELSPEMAEIAARNGVSEQVKTVQNVSHAELRAFYARATALVFPSLQEGFGWPLIEAQACGCAVFVSDLAPMNEIGGEGAVYIDPADAAGIARAIEQAAPRLGEMRRMGLENAQHYTAQQMASNYIAAYRRVIEERKARP
ncbi:MAG: glycosyltransferase family 4 protein [Gammaproteobacteria bacterium]|nr:glycosyltransferase family 4 protein [Gammaproteobacteria bacterium]MBU1440878.1 glycosyltransferase family 4 protein [Gammaproteobacteria bacterium]MBU2288943.1 glycosyltransferase family 4 protein [Gammaproteobacteria bacterium]